MKLNHNKKRNTAFLYEVLIAELTKSSLNNEKGLQEAVVKVLKEYFSRGKILAEELKLYKQFENLGGYGKDIIREVISKTIEERKKLDDKKIFNEQTTLINKINKVVGGHSFENFVPNYKNLATIYQIFSDKTPIKSRVILEKNMSDSLANDSQTVLQEDREKIDKTVYRIFTNKFNKKYSQLGENQQTLLKLYIESVRDGGLELKSFINQEIAEIKEAISQFMDQEESASLKGPLDSVKEELKSFKGQHINENILRKLLKMQALVGEIRNG